MKNIFNTIKLTKPRRNFFDLTHDVKQSAKMGELTPCLVMETVPGDKFEIGCDTLVRFAPLIAPVMHRMDVTIHYFFVPNRLVWENWNDFIFNNPENSPVPYPYITYPGTGVSAPIKRFLNYMGIPINTGGETAGIGALPFAAYQCIWNEYYRDQNLQAEIDYQLVDGNNSANGDLFVLRNRAWEHDYFTSALPFAQKGAAVDIPLGDVTLKDDWNLEGTPKFRDTNMDVAPDGTIKSVNNPLGGVATDDGTLTDVAYDPDGSLQTSATTINSLRIAVKLQEWLEKAARGGTRAIEALLVQFGVRSSDARLQRPEYITGVKSPVIISEVLNTTGEDGGLPQGNMAGHAVSVNQGYSGSYYCEEHGHIIGIMSVMPKPAYQQGIPKLYLKNDPLDHYWPSFAHLGEQGIRKDEIYAFTVAPETTWGYVPRYAEYKYMPSRVAGDFTTTLDYWHLGRIFPSAPALNADFITCDPADVSRIFAVEGTEDNLYCHILHKIKAFRPMPKYGTPSF